MSSRELLSTAGWSWDIVVAGEGGADWAEEESVWVDVIDMEYHSIHYY